MSVLAALAALEPVQISAIGRAVAVAPHHEVARPHPAKLVIRLTPKFRGAGRAQTAATMASSGPTSPPFTECPAVGSDGSGCQALILVGANGTQLLVDSSEGPYDGSDDALVGVLNSASQSISGLYVSATTNVFAFDGDGICNATYLNCSYGPTGYEGPNTSFSNISVNQTSGNVSFPSGLAAGQSTYFSLEALLSSSTVIATGPQQKPLLGGPIQAPELLGGANCACGNSEFAHHYSHDPVETAYGNFTETATDFSIPDHRSALQFTRTYNSLAAATDGPFGFGWTSNALMSVLSSGRWGPAVTVTEEGGDQVQYLSTSAGFSPPQAWSTNPFAGTTATLTGDVNGDGKADIVAVNFNAANGTGSTLVMTANGAGTAFNAPQTWSTQAFAGTTATLTGDVNGDGKADIVAVNYNAANGTGSTLVMTANGAGTAFNAPQTWSTQAFRGDVATLAADISGDGKADLIGMYPSGTAGFDYVATMTANLSGTGFNAPRSVGYISQPSAPTAVLAGDANGDSTDDVLIVNFDPSSGAGSTRVGLDYPSFDPVVPRVIAQLNPGVNGWDFARPGGDIERFSATGQLLIGWDRNSNDTDYRYNANNELTTIVRGSRSLTIGWAAGRISQVTDSNVSPPRTTTFQYNDSNGDLTDVIDASGGHTRYIYDSSHRITNVFDPNCYLAGSSCNSGNGVMNAYDSQGRVSSQTDQLGRLTTFGYSGDPASASGEATTVTDPTGHVTTDLYQYGVLTQQILGTGTAAAAGSESTYDPRTTAPTSATDANGHTAMYSVDSYGNRLSARDALGNPTAATFNYKRQPLTQTDALNVTTTYTYDTLGVNVTSIKRPLLDSGGSVIATRTTTYAYDGHGDVTSIVDPDGKAWTFSYDGYGDLVSTTDPIGHVSTASFNGDGWKLSSVSPRGNLGGCNCAAQYTTTYSYVDTVTGKVNGFGDVATVTDPLGRVAVYHYDANRNLVSTTDALGHATAYQFDLANEQTLITRPDQTTLHTDYNPDGTILDAKDGKGNTVFSYAYTPLGQIMSQVDALGNVTTFTYDNAGNQISQQDPSGNCSASPATGCTVMSYSVANQLTGITYSDPGTPDVTNITYDNDGQRTGMTDATGTSAWIWDSLHRLTGYTNGRGDTVSYEYNLRGLVTKLTYPGSLSVTRAYDAAGRWISVKDWFGYSTVFGYDADSNLTSKTLPAATGIKDTTVFDAAERLTSIGDTKGASSLFAATYGRDADGQVSNDSSLPSTLGSDRYTALNQLCYAGSSSTAACSAPPSGAQTYRFDAADNLLWNNGKTQAFDAADELCWTYPGATSSGGCTVPTGATRYDYSPTGNRTAVTPPTGSATHLSYDQANRLTSWGQGSTTTATYSYDGTGLRMSKTVSSVTTPFTWDVSGPLPLLIADRASQYIYGPGSLPVEQITTRPAISLVGTAAASGATTSLTLALPSGVQANDQVFVSSTEAAATAVTAPSGYSQVSSTTSAGKTVLFRHTATAGETSVTLTYSTNATPEAAVLAVYRGVDPGLPIDVKATGASASSTTVTGPSVTPIYAKDRLLIFQGAIGSFSGRAWTPPTSTTERRQINTTANVSAGFADQSLAGVAATGTRVSTFGTSANLTTVVVAISPPPTILFYHADQLGTTRLLTDIVGAVRGTRRYDPYGNLTSTAGAYTTPLAFAGEYRDSETGFYYLRSRYYDPVTAQFLTRDPAGRATRALYRYVSNNPVNYRDPSGLWYDPNAYCPGMPSAPFNDVVICDYSGTIELSNPTGLAVSGCTPAGDCFVYTGCTLTQLDQGTYFTLPGRPTPPELAFGAHFAGGFVPTIYSLPPPTNLNSATASVVPGDCPAGTEFGPQFVFPFEIWTSPSSCVPPSINPERNPHD